MSIIIVGEGAEIESAQAWVHHLLQFGQMDGSAHVRQTGSENANWKGERGSLISPSDNGLGLRPEGTRSRSSRSRGDIVGGIMV